MALSDYDPSLLLRCRAVNIFVVLWFTLDEPVNRPVMFSLRVAVAAKPNTESPGLSEYMQATFALGYLTLAEILLRLVRSILVNTTNGTSSADTESHYPAVTQPPPLVSISPGFWKPSLPPPSPSVPNVDDPRRRFWFRRWCEFLLSLYIVAMVLAVVATAHVWKATDSGWNSVNQALRCVPLLIWFELF
jgi:hypothetical protein